MDSEVAFAQASEGEVKTGRWSRFVDDCGDVQEVLKIQTCLIAGSAGAGGFPLASDGDVLGEVLREEGGLAYVSPSFSAYLRLA